MYINTNNVGDAAMVFRCLVNALDYSLEKELARLEKVLDILEIDSWNEEGKEEEEEEEAEGGNEKQLKCALEKLRSAVRYEWTGMLLSRIVGTCSSSTTLSTTEDNNPMIPSSAAGGTTTTSRRTKKNGNIERPIPIPFPLPVIMPNVPGSKQKRSQKKENQGGDDQRQYFPSLTQSLNSVTIEPNPIKDLLITASNLLADLASFLPPLACRPQPPPATFPPPSSASRRIPIFAYDARRLAAIEDAGATTIQRWARRLAAIARMWRVASARRLAAIEDAGVTTIQRWVRRWEIEGAIEVQNALEELLEVTDPPRLDELNDLQNVGETAEEQIG